MSGPKGRYNLLDELIQKYKRTNIYLIQIDMVVWK